MKQTTPQTSLNALESRLIGHAAKLLHAALQLAKATNNPAMVRRAEMLHDNQGLAPVLTITCAHADLSRIALDLSFCETESGDIKATLFSLTAQAETVQ